MAYNKDNYDPLVFEFPELTDDMFKTKFVPKFSKNIDYPNFSLGFHHYIHQSKDKMEITDQFKGKKKVYNVINRFEPEVDEFNDSISDVLSKKIKLSKDIANKNSSFFKLWEMFFMFDLIPADKENFTSAHLSDHDNSFLNATISYRNYYSEKKAQKDKHYSVENKNNLKDKKITILKSVLNKSSKDKVHMITSNFNFEPNHENTQEQEAYLNILEQIIGALHIQDKGGVFVLKMFETFTETSSKILYILSHFYKKIYATKPFMSNNADSEKYIICQGFKSSDSRIKILEKIYDSAIKNKKLNLVDFFEEFKIPKNFKNTLIKLNTDVANNQFKTINEMITFINKKNYYGEDYQDRRKMQIEANNFWNQHFIPSAKDLNVARLKTKEMRDNSLNENKIRIINLEKVIS
jgi:hypothetical protein